MGLTAVGSCRFESSQTDTSIYLKFSVELLSTLSPKWSWHPSECGFSVWSWASTRGSHLKGWCVRCVSSRGGAGLPRRPERAAIHKRSVQVQRGQDVRHPLRRVPVHERLHGAAQVLRSVGLRRARLEFATTVVDLAPSTSVERCAIRGFCPGGHVTEGDV